MKAQRRERDIEKPPQWIDIHPLDQRRSGGTARPFLVVLAILLVLDVVVAPVLARADAALAFADWVAGYIDGLYAAAAVVDFERQARVILAVDRISVIVLLATLVAMNTRLQVNAAKGPIVALTVFLVFSLVMAYVSMNPIVPEPSPGFRRNAYEMVTGSHVGFAMVHGLSTYVFAGSLYFVVVLTRRYRLIRSAHRRWRHWDEVESKWV